MRERGLDPATCEEIESLASSIVATSSLQNPADDRVRKLTAVLAYLERRIAGGEMGLPLWIVHELVQRVGLAVVEVGRADRKAEK